MKNKMRILMTLVLATLFVACGVQKLSTQKSSSQQTISVKHKIYGVAVSPYVTKVRMYMEANKIPYELEEVLPLSLLKASGKKEHVRLKEISPLGQIPAYENGKTTIADSAVIMQYLEDTVSGEKISAEEQAEVNFIEKYADSKLSSSTHTILVQKIVKPLVLKQEIDLEIVKDRIQAIHSVLEFLDKKLEGKSYFVAERLTKADFAVMAHLGSLLRTDLIKETVDHGDYPALSSYFNRLMKEPFFKVTHELS